jgi:S-adenosylmethionine decarboxylase
MTEPTSFGPHLTVDARGCDRTTLVNEQFVYNILDQLPAQLDMTKMIDPVVKVWKDKFAETPGVSGFVMIAESHISIHTFPDFDYVFMDIFSCRAFDVEKTKQLVMDAFKAQHATCTVVERGLDFPRPELVK